jgi:hypothetical protein
MIHDQYYENGFFRTQVDGIIKKLLWNEIYNTEWVDDTEEHIYKQIPIWYKSCFSSFINPDGSNRAEYERIIGQDILNNTPKSLITLGNQLLETPPFEFFKRYYKNHELKSIDMWNGCEEIPYHFDTINGADTLVLIYLTEENNWQKDWGGTITMKKHVGNKIYFEEEFMPTNESMIVINNANPLVFHKVKAMQNSAVNRYTFSFIYKWL